MLDFTKDEKRVIAYLAQQYLDGMSKIDKELFNSKSQSVCNSLIEKVKAD